MDFAQDRLHQIVVVRLAEPEFQEIGYIVVKKMLRLPKEALPMLSLERPKLPLLGLLI